MNRPTPVFVLRSVADSPETPNNGACIYCGAPMQDELLIEKEFDDRMRSVLERVQKVSYGKPLSNLSITEWEELKLGRAAHWEAWGRPPPKTIQDEIDLFFNFYEAHHRCCARCGWWSNGITTNHGAGGQRTSSAALLQFDIQSSQLTIPEIMSHLSRHFSDIYALSSRRFEEVIGDVYKSMGWQVALTKQSRDGGVDIYCCHGSSDGLCIVECKRYQKSRRVGIAVIDRLLGVAFRTGASAAHLVTTSGFSRPAKTASRMAMRQSVEVNLVDAHDLARLLDIYSDKNLTVSDVESLLCSRKPG